MGSEEVIVAFFIPRAYLNTGNGIITQGKGTTLKAALISIPGIVTADFTPWVL